MIFRVRFASIKFGILPICTIKYCSMVSYTWVEPFPDWEIDNSWGTLSTHSKNRFLMFNIAACVRLTTKTPRTKTISTLKLTSLLYYNKSQTKWTCFSEFTQWQTNFTIQRCTLTRTGMLIPLAYLLVHYILLSCFRLQSSFRVHKTTLMRQCLLACPRLGAIHS